MTSRHRLTRWEDPSDPSDDLVPHIWSEIELYHRMHDKGYRPLIIIAPRTFVALCKDSMASLIIDFKNKRIFDTPYEIQEIKDGPDVSIVHRFNMASYHTDLYANLYMQQVKFP